MIPDVLSNSPFKRFIHLLSKHYKIFLKSSYDRPIIFPKFDNRCSINHFNTKLFLNPISFLFSCFLNWVFCFSGNAIGLILPNDILDVEKQQFEEILQNLTKEDQDLKQYDECLEYSEQVSEGLKKGAEYVGRGMVKGAIKSSEWMYLG